MFVDVVRLSVKGRFMEQKFDVLVLNETKLKGKGDCEFGCVSGRMSGVTRGKTREGVKLMVSLAETLCGEMEGGVIKADVCES